MLSEKPTTALSYTLMILLGFIFVAPLLFMMCSSFKSEGQIFSDLQSARAFLPVGELTLDNYRSIFSESKIGLYFINSSIIAIITVVLGVLINSMAAFGLQRCEWRGQNLVLAIVLGLLVIPFEVLAIPLMMIVVDMPWPTIQDGKLAWQFSWFNSMHVQIIPFIANVFIIFLFYQFFQDIPKQLDEAAKMDGAGPFTLYFKIIMPNAMPVVATSCIILFMAMWNQYLWPILVVQGQDVRPIMVGIQQFFGHTNAWGEIMAYATLVTLPVLSVFIAFQGFFVRSVVSSGIK